MEIEKDVKAGKNRRTLLNIIIASILIALAIIIIIVVVLNKDEQKDDRIPEPDYKFTSIETITLPEGITYEGHAIYSKTGHVILLENGE